MMNRSEVAALSPLLTADVVDYVPNSIATTTIMTKPTGNVTVMAFDSGQGIKENISRFAVFVQIIEGNAELIIDKISHLLHSGHGIVIPAHTVNSVTPKGRFKMMLTVIKSGYE